MLAPFPRRLIVAPQMGEWKSWQGHLNIWLGTSIDDTLKDEIRVTVVATGVRQDRADKVAGVKAQPRKVTSVPSQPAAPVTERIDSAAPPRVSPSSLVMTTPVIPNC